MDPINNKQLIKAVYTTTTHNVSLKEHTITAGAINENPIKLRKTNTLRGMTLLLLSAGIINFFL